jgi:hypothetical protein
MILMIFFNHIIKNIKLKPYKIINKMADINQAIKGDIVKGDIVKGDIVEWGIAEADIVDIEYEKEIHKLDELLTDELLFNANIIANPEIIVSIVNKLLYKGIQYSKKGESLPPKLEMELHKKLVMKSFDQLCSECFEHKLSKSSEDLITIIGKELRKI